MPLYTGLGKPRSNHRERIKGAAGALGGFTRSPVHARKQGMTDLVERTRQARSALENAIVEALGHQPGGLYNNELARLLDLESDYEGRQSNYLTYSLLGGLLASGRVSKEKRDGRTYYVKAG